MFTTPYAEFPIPMLNKVQGWTEHIGPSGQPYYYNSLTRESTYICPPFIVQSHTSIKKKDKPLLKTPIPGTDWLRVTTTEGNVFYSHKVKKESVWVAPDELRPALAALQSQDIQREVSTLAPSGTGKAKRKVDETIPIDEVEVYKKAKVEEYEDEESEDEDEAEEEWQLEATRQLAAEAEEELKQAEERSKDKARPSPEAREIVVPQRVELSIEEGKALFKTLLREKDINPLHPWDTSLPKFIQDARYVLLPSVAARREAFDDYCRERARELRQSSAKKEREILNPKDEFEQLLKEEIKSTRASWTDFRRLWKKDRRFYGWGRDDREREKKFKDFMKGLGEQKRATAQKVEAQFFALLREHVFIAQGTCWKEAKKIIYKDPRYDSVGSSSLREELFNTFVKGNDAQSSSHQVSVSQSLPIETLSHEERRNKAVQEREDKIKSERRRLDAGIERSKMGIGKEEGERTFTTMLTDAIRDPQTTWDSAISQLKIDQRFTDSSLPLNQQLRLFHSHISRLRGKQLVNLHSLFNAHAPSLSTSFKTLPLENILSSAPAVKLGLNTGQLEVEFNMWQTERTNAARLDFDNMMAENSFVEFWGRLSKIGGQGINGGLQIDGEDIGEDGEEKVDMKMLAKSVDIQEMEKVLRNDKRYIMFDHISDQREKWIRDYLSRLSAPKLSVHVEG